MRDDYERGSKKKIPRENNTQIQRKTHFFDFQTLTFPLIFRRIFPKEETHPENNGGTPFKARPDLGDVFPTDFPTNFEYLDEMGVFPHVRSIKRHRSVWSYYERVGLKPLKIPV